MKIKWIYTLILTLLILLVPMGVLATWPIAGETSARDQADATVYNDGWGSGDDGGLGFGAWALATSGANAGHFIGTSTNNGDGDTNADGAIDTSGETWGMWATPVIHLKLCAPSIHP